MSYSFTFYKDPGLLVDSIKLISIGLNDFSIMRSCIAPISPSEEDKKEIQHLKTVIKKMPVLPKELLLFFYKNDSVAPNFLSELLLTLLDEKFNTLTLSSFTRLLSDTNFMKNKLFCFYFNHYPSSLSEGENLIRTSSILPDKMKVYLLGFYIHPEPYLTQLTSFIKQYYQRIHQYYYTESSTKTIDENSLISLINYDHPELKNMHTCSFSYSICHVIYRFLAYNIAPTQNWIITGINFSDTINSITTPPSSNTIEKIFAALGDPHRLKIVKILHENGSQNTADILSRLEIAPSSLSHHLRVLKKAGIITSTKNKNGFHYSLNRMIFTPVTELLNILKGGLAE